MTIGIPYALGELLYEGGSVVVRRARDVETGARVILKMCKPDQAGLHETQIQKIQITNKYNNRIKMIIKMKLLTLISLKHITY